MISKQYTIQSSEGFHARPATKLIKLVRQFRSTVEIQQGKNQIKLNSVLNLLTLGLQKGDLLTIIIAGDDELEAGMALDLFFNEELKNL